MKKSTVLILTIIYLAVSTGIVINLHYCMNKLASTHIYGGENKKCGKCGMDNKKSKGCCRDEVKILKMDDDQKLTSLAAATFAAPEAIVYQPSLFLCLPTSNAATKGVHHSHSPPILAGQDTYLLHCVFRI